ncbi:MAG TPA: chemotaxis protein CheW [Roseiflexaceae bacterium]|nr:chemotaxis protein CheW [Roseiflexaceae bacterium]
MLAPLDVLLLQLTGELYGLPSGSVREVLRYRPYTPVPGAPPALPGILSQRGTILPIVELRALLGLELTPVTRATRLVVVAHQDIDMALLAEAVLDLAALPADIVEPLPAALDPARARFLRGIARYEQQPVALLDLDELIVGLRAGA